MNTKVQVGLAVAAGYFLGRTHRMKTALMLAGAGLTGRFPGAPRDLLERGGKALAGSPEVAELGRSIRGELLTAAKSAAMAAASERIDSLSSRLQSGPGEVLEGVTEAVPSATTSRARREEPEPEPEPADEYDEEPADEESDEELVEEEAPRARKRPAARRRATGDARPARTRASARSDDSDDEAPARSRKATASSGSTPVRRTRK